MPVASVGSTIAAMSKPKKTRPVDATVYRVKGYQLPARVNDHMKAILQQEAKKERRKLAQIVEILLEEALRARGSWVEPTGD